MLVDTSLFMYGVFQSCRHALRNSGTGLNLLAEILEIIKQQDTLVIEVPDDWAKKNGFQERVIAPDAASKRDSSLSSANQKLFTLVYIGTHELQRLWALESKHAVRRLGYALHNIPRLLWTPDQFNPKWYMSCFQLVGGHWNELSLEMRQAFCTVLNLELEDATTLANSDEFSISASPSQE